MVMHAHEVSPHFLIDVGIFSVGSRTPGTNQLTNPLFYHFE